MVDYGLCCLIPGTESQSETEQMMVDPSMSLETGSTPTTEDPLDQQETGPTPSSPAHQPSHGQ